MTRVTFALLLTACAAPVVNEERDARDSPGWTEANLLTRHPASVPEPTPYDAECDAPGAVCGYHAAHSTEYLGDGAYEVVVFWMHARVGNVIPTPDGRARVTRIMPQSHPGAGDEWVQLHFLEPTRPMPPNVQAIALGDEVLVANNRVTLSNVEGDVATVSFFGETAQSVRAGDIVASTHSGDGFGVVEVVAPRPGAEIGWMLVKPFERRRM